jgi:hypothetical protein
MVYQSEERVVRLVDCSLGRPRVAPAAGAQLQAVVPQQHLRVRIRRRHHVRRRHHHRLLGGNTLTSAEGFRMEPRRVSPALHTDIHTAFTASGGRGTQALRRTFPLAGV